MKHFCEKIDHNKYFTKLDKIIFCVMRPVFSYEGILSEDFQREDFFDRIIRFAELLVKLGAFGGKN